MDSGGGYAYRLVMSIQPSDSILIIDFGSQVTQLIARRVREIGVRLGYMMGRADLIGNGKQHLIPTFQPLTDGGYQVRARRTAPRPRAVAGSATPSTRMAPILSFTKMPMAKKRAKPIAAAINKMIKTKIRKIKTTRTKIKTKIRTKTKKIKIKKIIKTNHNQNQMEQTNI